MITQNEIETRIQVYLGHHLSGRKIRAFGASDMLRCCIQREYEDDNFSMRKRADSPFADQNRFQLHADYNKYDFMFDEFDIYDHIEIFGATALPRKDFENVAIAAAYPLPNRTGTDWLKGANGEWAQGARVDHSKGSYSWAILYYNGELPDIDWQPSLVLNYPHSDTYVTQKLMWDDEREGRKEISNYWRNTQLPYDAGVYAERQKQGIPLTEYQQKVVEAGGWPYGSAPPKQTMVIPSGVSNAKDAPVDQPGKIPSGVANAADAPVEEIETTAEKYADLIAYCREYRDKWTLAENPHHHHRWNSVIEMISEDHLGNAITYSKEWAEKGWKPWQVFIEMCQKRIGE